MPRLRLIDRKLSRQADPRRILVRNLATQLVEHGRITTTRPKAKALLPYAERLVSTAKKGDLSARRYAAANLDTVAAAHRLLDVIAPQMKRTSGYIRLTAVPNRRGDDAPQAMLEFVDEIKELPRSEVKSTPAKKTPVKAKKTKKAAKPKETKS